MPEKKNYTFPENLGCKYLDSRGISCAALSGCFARQLLGIVGDTKSGVEEEAIRASIIAEAKKAGCKAVLNLEGYNGNQKG